MPTAYKFIPARIADLLDYLTDVSASITATPTAYGLVAADATALAGALNTAKSDHATLVAAIAAKKNATEALTGPAGAIRTLTELARSLANKARASTATDSSLADIGIYRRDPIPTPIPAPTTPPEFGIADILPGEAIVRFRAAGSSRPRARANGAIGVQVSLVTVDNGAPPATGEADSGVMTFVARTLRPVPTAGEGPGIRAYARWQTAKGEVSPWTSPVTFVAQPA
jgi:hypothetical protein